MAITEQEFLASYPQKVAPGGPTGYPGNLTPEQEQKLGELKMILVSKGYEERIDDATLLRFLRARKFDVNLALEMWENCEKWREEFGTNTILEDFWYKEKKEVAKLYPQYYHKTDKDGRPVYVENVGQVNIHEMYKITTQERMVRNLVWEYESFVKHRLPACSRMTGHLIETSCTILDLKGVSLSSASQVYGFLKEASNIGQNYYPERMGKFYLINAPFGFSAVFSVIKRFLDPVTVEKIHVYGSSYKEKLLAQVPAYNLPIKFGGQSTSEIGVELSDDGPWRDPKYVGPEGMAPVAGQKPTGAPSIVSSVSVDTKAENKESNGVKAAGKAAAPQAAAPQANTFSPEMLAMMEKQAQSKPGAAAPQANTFTEEQLAQLNDLPKKVAAGDAEISKDVPTVAKVAEAAAGPREDAHLPQ